MSEISIHIDGEFDPQPNETFIGLINIDRPPFHLVTISNMEQFSWEVEKSRIGEPVRTLIRHLNRNQTRSLFLKVSEDDTILSQVESAYRNSPDAKSCIDPINNFLLKIAKKTERNPLTVFELMDHFKTNSLWTKTYGLNLNEGAIKLNVYDRTIVDRHVEGLKLLDSQRS